MKRDRDDSVCFELQTQDSFLEDSESPPASPPDTFFLHNGLLYCKLCNPKLTKDNVDTFTFKGQGRGKLGVLKNYSTTKRRHEEFHSQEAATPGVTQNATTPTTACNTTKRQAATPTSVAIFVAASGVAFNFFSSDASALLTPIFEQAGVAKNRRALSGLLVSEAALLRTSILSRAKGQSGVLMIDGGTVCHRTFLNITLSLPCGVFFWRSHPVARLDALTVGKIVSDTLEELRKSFVWVLAVVSDNASAMVSACNFECSDDDEDELDMFVAEEIEFNEEPGEFVSHVRCWAHTLQLLYSDMVAANKHIATAFENTALIVIELKKRKVAQNLAHILKATGSRITTIHVPSVTRWNSHLRAMLRIIEIAPQVAQVLEGGLNDDVLYAMKIAATVLLPVAWATDQVQSDHCTVVDALKHLSTVTDHMEWLKSIAFEQRTKRHVTVATDDLLTAVKARTKKNFTNKFTQLIDFFDGSTKEKMEYNSVAADIEQYYLDRGTAPDTKAIAKSLAQFKIRATENKKSTYWDDKLVTDSWVVEFLLDIKNALVTEASVERSFMLQSKLFRPERTRLTTETMNALMFMKGNTRNFTSRTAAPRSHTLPLDEWKILATTLCTPTANRPTRRTSTDASMIRFCSKIEVAFNEDGEQNWYVGTVTGGSGDDFTIVYETDPLKIEAFKPLTVDTDWRFAE